MTVLYAGIDIGKRNHAVTFLTIDGEQVGQTLAFKNSMSGVERLIAQAMNYNPDRIIFGIESTGHYGTAIYEHLVKSGYEVKSIHPLQSSGIRKLFIRGAKNDRKDSLNIAEALRIGHYIETFTADESIIKLKELSRMRAEIQDHIRIIKNRIICLLDRFFPEFEQCFASTLCVTAREILKTFPAPEDLADCSLDNLTELITKTSRGRNGVNKGIKLKDLAATSFGATIGLDAYRIMICQQLEHLSFVEAQVDQIEEHIKEIMASQKLILTIPGVGPILGAAIIGEIGDISRFSSAKKLTAFAGLDPTVRQSGEYTATHSHISKRGSRYLRTALWMAAHNARRYDLTFKRYYELKLSQGKYPHQALGAVAAKLCRVIYAVLSKNTAYDPNWNVDRDSAKGIDLLKAM